MLSTLSEKKRAFTLAIQKRARANLVGESIPCPRAYTLFVKRRAHIIWEEESLYLVSEEESQSLPCPCEKSQSLPCLSVKRRAYTLSVKKMAAKPFFWTELSERNSRRRLFPSEVITWTIVSSMHGLIKYIDTKAKYRHLKNPRQSLVR